MQISKLLPAIGMGVLCLGLVSVRADDTLDQAAARAALMEKMAELDNASAPTNTDMSTATNPPAESPEPAAAPPIVVNAPVPDTNETPVAQPLPENAPVSAPVIVNAPMSETSTPVVSPTPPPPSSTGYNAAAQAALNQSQANPVIVKTSAAPSAAPAPANNPQAPDVNDVMAKQLGLAPLQPPPAPVSAEQQDQLNALLHRYEADQISPDEYQAERAKILAAQ